MASPRTYLPEERRGLRAAASAVTAGRPLPAEGGDGSSASLDSPISAGAAPAAEGVRVYLHACGRLETPVVSSVTVEQVTVAARLAFDFSSTQELALVDKDGEPLSTATTLCAVVDKGEAIYVRLPDTALHEFERRIDQLMHMQVGHLCDQFASFRQEQGELYMELQQLRSGLDKERAGREFATSGLRREIEELRLGGQRSAQQGSDRAESIEALLHALKGSLQEEAATRERSEHDVQRRLMEIRDTLLAEGKAREHGDEKLRYEIEESRRAQMLEATDREDGEVRNERSLQDIRSALTEVADKNEIELAELRKHLLDTKQAVAVEERERITADNDLASLTKELRGLLQGEVRDRMTEAATVNTRHAQLEMHLETEKVARSQAVAELTSQVGAAVKSIQEEQTLRASEGLEMLQSLEHQKQRHGDSEISTTRHAHDLERRFNEEVHRRETEFSKLSRLLSDECDKRTEQFAKVNTMLVGLQEAASTHTERTDRMSKDALTRVETCLERVKNEARERNQLKTDMHERLTEGVTSGVAQDVRDAQERLDRLGETSREVETTLRTLADEVQELKEGHAKESQAREKAHMALSRSVAQAADEARNCLKDLDSGPAQALSAKIRNEVLEQALSAGGGREQALSAKIRNEVLEASAADIDGLRDGLTKVVEAAQQERKSRTEGDNKLREDCREAIQKEINARVELERRLTQEIEGENRSRMEAVELLGLAIQECRELVESQAEDLNADD